MQLLFSLLFLVVAYFLTSLALIQGYFPLIRRTELKNPNKISLYPQYRKILGISLLISIFFTLIMFYFFISPSAGIY